MGFKKICFNICMIPILATICLCIYLNYFEKPILTYMGDAKFIKLDDGRRLAYEIYGKS